MGKADIEHYSEGLCQTLGNKTVKNFGGDQKESPPGILQAYQIDSGICGTCLAQCNHEQPVIETRMGPKDNLQTYLQPTVVLSGNSEG